MTLGILFGLLSDDDWAKRGPGWPPDAFALCATALARSGSYTRAVTKWPPEASGKDWAKMIAKIGRDWRKTAPKGRTPTPVGGWWKVLVSQQEVQLHELVQKQNQALVDILLQISAAADEASAGIGLSEAADDPFDRKLRDIFATQISGAGYISTVCETMNPNQVRVLPKLHTPRSGMTIRSLSHNLALCPGGEVIPKYWPIPNVMKIEETMNLLLVPWPKVVRASDFSAVGTEAGPLRNMPGGFGFFQYEIPEDKSSKRLFRQILRQAEKTAGKVNGVVFPELALRPKMIEVFWKVLNGRETPCFLIAGTADRPRGGSLGNNKAVCHVPVFKDLKLDLRLEQIKHHRWGLDPAQLQQYSLTSRLPADRFWWEASDIPARCLHFVPLSPYAVLSFLVCEDLARQDPIADSVRSVGPNLVIALLMDGPQLTGRWSSRYATVLADDPGCSVLTLTSIGMARMSRSLGKPESRVVALWKDSRKGPYEIELPFDAEALVLSLKLRRDSEWSADGRCSKETAGCWELEGVHPVKLA